MGCFLTGTVADLEQMNKQISKQRVPKKSSPMSQENFIHKVKSDVLDVANACLNIDSAKLEAASQVCSFDEINNILLQMDDAVDGGWLNKQDAARESEAILSDIVKAAKVRGLTSTTTSPVELMSKHDVGTHEWRGSRFELRYAAIKANEISEIDCSNYVDVRMKDGSYRELKSFTVFGRDQRRDVIEQLRKDIDPVNRNINDIKIVLDSSYATPSDSFLDQLHRDIEQLIQNINPSASIGCQVATSDGLILDIF